jgi:hypothetical protein
MRYSCSGAAGAGSLTQLIGVGALDAYLTQNPQHTYWKLSYKKHTAFALEAIAQPFQSTVGFGSECQITLNRSGDMVFYQYVIVDLPGIVACDAQNDSSCAGIAPGGQFPMYMDQSCAPCAKYDEAAVAEFLGDGFTDATDSEKARRLSKAKDQWLRTRYGAGTSLQCGEEVDDCPDVLCPELNGVWAHYTNDIGHWLVKTARIVIGGSVVDTLHSEFLFVWEELCGRAGRRLTEMVGKRFTRTQLILDSRQRRTLYIPLPFFYCQTAGNALPLASLQFHGVQLFIEFARLEHCVVVSGNNVVVKNADTGTALANTDLTACLESTYVYLDNAEREKFSTRHFEVLITQTQAYTQQSTNSQVRINLTFNHPCLELIWLVRRQCQERANNWYNFSGIDGRDPVESASLNLNNQPRFNKPGSWFRLVQPYQHHTNIPDVFIYVFSFALFPESEVPSGSCNLSRIDHVDLNLTLQQDLGKEQVTILVYCRNWNILRFREGLAGLAYAN